MFIRTAWKIQLFASASRLSLCPGHFPKLEKWLKPLAAYHVSLELRMKLLCMATTANLAIMMKTVLFS